MVGGRCAVHLAAKFGNSGLCTACLTPRRRSRRRSRPRKGPRTATDLSTARRSATRDHRGHCQAAAQAARMRAGRAAAAAAAAPAAAAAAARSASEAASASARSAAAASYVAAESASEPASRQTRAPPPRRVPRLAGPRKLWRKLPSRSSPPARSKSARASPQPGMKHRRRAPARGPGEWGRNGSSCAAPRPRPRLLSSCHRLPPQRVAEAQRFLICCPPTPSPHREVAHQKVCERAHGAPEVCGSSRVASWVLTGRWSAPRTAWGRSLERNKACTALRRGDRLRWAD